MRNQAKLAGVKFARAHVEAEARAAAELKRLGHTPAASPGNDEGETRGVEPHARVIALMSANDRAFKARLERNPNLNTPPLSGAPSHSAAELLTALDGLGWELVRKPAPVSDEGEGREGDLRERVAAIIAGSPQCSCGYHWGEPDPDKMPSCPEHGEGAWPWPVHRRRADRVIREIAALAPVSVSGGEGDRPTPTPESVDRWKLIGTMEQHPEGPWVRFEDFERLFLQSARLVWKMGEQLQGDPNSSKDLEDRIEKAIEAAAKARFQNEELERRVRGGEDYEPEFPTWESLTVDRQQDYESEVEDEVWAVLPFLSGVGDDEIALPAETARFLVNFIGNLGPRKDSQLAAEFEVLRAALEGGNEARPAAGGEQ